MTDGRWLRVSQSGTSDGGSIVVCSDISLLKQQEETLKGINLRLDAALDNMSQGLCLFDAEHKLQVVNRRFCEIFGLPREKLQPGMKYRNILELSVAAGNHPGKTVEELIDDQRRFIGHHGTGTHLVDLTGSRVVACVHRPTSDGGFVATYEDVTERRQAEARIAYMARHDALTGLPNRVVFGERVEQALADMGRGNGFAVLSVDVDHFKQVNDTLGHPIGDELLRVGGASAAVLHPGGRHGRPAGRRRIRHRAARCEAARGRRATGAPHHRGCRLALRHQRAPRDHRHQHRHLTGAR